MKRLALAALVVLAISSFAVLPAFAADTCDMDMTMHQPTVPSLIAHVQHANSMGHINATLMTALMAPLNTAANESLPVAARAGALQAFINLVNAQAGKGINADCAQHLLMQAQQSITALKAQM